MLLISFVSFGARAQQSEIFSTNGKAIRGYDAVAFFKDGKAVSGSDSLTYAYRDAQWSFASAENREAFKADPEHFAPQYGGYCAYGTAAGHKAPTETETWSIVNDKLYFNYNMKVKGVWIKDQQAFIKKADQRWPLIREKE